MPVSLVFLFQFVCLSRLSVPVCLVSLCQFVSSLCASLSVLSLCTSLSRLLVPICPSGWLAGSLSSLLFLAPLPPPPPPPLSVWLSVCLSLRSTVWEISTKASLDGQTQTLLFKALHTKWAKRKADKCFSFMSHCHLILPVASDAKRSDGLSALTNSIDPFSQSC